MSLWLRQRRSYANTRSSANARGQAYARSPINSDIAAGNATGSVHSIRGTRRIRISHCSNPDRDRNVGRRASRNPSTTRERVTLQANSSRKRRDALCLSCAATSFVLDVRCLYPPFDRGYFNRTAKLPRSGRCNLTTRPLYPASPTPLPTPF